MTVPVRGIPAGAVAAATAAVQGDDVYDRLRLLHRREGKLVGGAWPASTAVRMEAEAMRARASIAKIEGERQERARTVVVAIEATSAEMRAAWVICRDHCAIKCESLAECGSAALGLESAFGTKYLPLARAVLKAAGDGESCA